MQATMTTAMSGFCCWGKRLRAASLWLLAAGVQWLCLVSSAGGFPSGPAAADDITPGIRNNTAGDTNSSTSTTATPHNATSLPSTSSPIAPLEDSLSQALLIYVMAGLCLLTMVVLLCKYYVCQRTEVIVCRAPPVRTHAQREQAYKQLTDSGMVFMFSNNDLK